MYSLINKMRTICKNKNPEKESIKNDIKKTKKDKITIKKIFHSCFLITYPENITILTDPFFNNQSLGNLKLIDECKFKKEELPKIDIVLISHEHFDHFDKDAINYLVNRDKSIVVGPLDVTKQLNLPKTEERTIKVDDEIVVATINIKVLTAQHHQSFYPVGYILEKDNKTIYFAGDTNTLPNIYKEINIAILPCGGILTADLFEFISMARQLKCEFAIPMHYNTFDLIKIDCEKLKARAEEKLKNCEIKCLNNNEAFEYEL